MEGGQFDDNQFNQLIGNNQPPAGGENFNDFSQNSNDHNRTKREKFISFAILLVAVVAVFFGYFQLMGNFNQPFLKFFDSIAVDGNQSCPDGNCQEANDSSALLVDTDGDGLLDYEELTIYKTSPYLEDSDGDGMSDKYEVEMGYAPDCPGKDPCFVLDAGSGGEDMEAVPAFFAEAPSAQMTAPSAAALREIFATSGIPQEELDQLTDEEIMILYSRLATQEQASQTVEIAPATEADLNVNISSMEDLENLTGAQIRALLVAQGMPESALAGISDEDLRTMFLAQLAEQANN